MNRPLAIVTGAAQGIGAAITQRLIDDGFFVAMVDRVEFTLDHEMTRHASSHVCNVCVESEVKSLFNELVERHTHIAVVVNNAGITRDNMVWRMSEEEFDEVINVNLKGCWLMCREAAGLMREQRKGRIINISSRGWLGNPGQTNYAASKAGVIGLTRVLALELGKYNVVVNAVAPGFIETPMTSVLSDEVKQRLVETQPIRSLGQPRDVANAVSFLAREDTTFITGQTLYVDGGKSIGSNAI